MEARGQGGGAERGGGQATFGMDADRTTGIITIDLELDRPRRRTHARRHNGDRGREGHTLAEGRWISRRADSRTRAGPIDHLATRERSAACRETAVAAVAGRNGMAAHRQGGSAEGGGGHAACGTDADRATDIAAIDLELDR